MNVPIPSVPRLSELASKLTTSVQTDPINSNSAGVDCPDKLSTTSVLTVAHVRVVSGQGGGPDKTILNSPRFLEGHGYRAVCAYMHPPDDAGFEQLRRKAESWRAPLITIPDRGLRDMSVVVRLLKMCREQRVDIWHAHDYKSNLIGLMLKPFWPMKLVTTVHGWVSTAGRIPLYYRLDRYLLRYYRRVICVSEDLLNECLEHKVPADRCVLVHNAIDTDEFTVSRDKAAAKARVCIDPKRFVIGAVGRLAAEKGFDVLIRAVDRLVREGYDLQLVIVGEGEQRSQLEALIAELGHGERIKLLGYHPNVIQVFHAMDVFALSSLREGLPNVVLEALSTGIPLVATRIAGIPNMIQDGESGLLIKPNCVDELTNALRRLFIDPELREQLATNGRQLVEDRYSFSVRMAKIRAIYDELFNRPRAYSPLEQVTNLTG